MATHETILLGDDRPDRLTLVGGYLKKMGHEVVFEATSVDQVRQAVDSGVNFTVAVLDNRMPQVGDGQLAADYIRQHRSDVIIISLSASNNVTFGDFNLMKGKGPDELVETIKAIKR